MVLDPIPQSLPVHFFGSRPQPPTSLTYHELYHSHTTNSIIYVFAPMRHLGPPLWQVFHELYHLHTTNLPSIYHELYHLHTTNPIIYIPRIQSSTYSHQWDTWDRLCGMFLTFTNCIIYTSRTLLSKYHHLYQLHTTNSVTNYRWAAKRHLGSPLWKVCYELYHLHVTNSTI